MITLKCKRKLLNPIAAKSPKCECQREGGLAAKSGTEGLINNEWLVFKKFNVSVLTLIFFKTIIFNKAFLSDH